MKSIKILLFFFCFATGTAQIKNIDGPGNEYAQTGVYYKDLNNFFDPFIGTFIYSNGTTTFEIVLQKKLHSSNGDVYFEDVLIGAYRYVENGIEKVNVLNDLDNNYPRGTTYKISGRAIFTGKEGCPQCDINEKWIYGTIQDPVSGSIDRLDIRKLLVGGQPAIKIFITHEIGYRNVNDTSPVIPISYPIAQEFILLKQ
jgi:hypothetical protein